MINKQLDFESLRREFSQGEIKRIVIKDLFETDFIRKCEDEFKKIQEEKFLRYSDPHFEYEKYTLNNVDEMPSNIRKIFNFIHSEEFIQTISLLTGLSPLYIDEKRWGGGIHKTKKDGYLSVHKDFTVLPTTYPDETQMLRCINLIGYMTEEWKDEDGGHLEFWDKTGTRVVEKIPLDFNTWVIFDTRDNYHGHPYPYLGEVPRMSIASYYYIREKVDESKWSSTEYLKLPWMDDSEEYRKKREDRRDHKKRYSSLGK
jgi:Rps23 Pro-64 3,4-dihydroxylase Tpa1-like proline 4-hydroxylase